ncbi:MAG: hypothetical protein AB8C95_06900 [Phycisphaeraceae bacterium]
MSDARKLQRTVYGVLLCALVAFAGRREAQEVPQPQPAPAVEAQGEAEDLGPMSIDIDIQRLLFDTSGSSFQDAVWQIQPGPGKRILLLPFTVDNVNRVNKLARFPISVRAGRFIGFVIPKPQLNNASNSSGNDLNRIIRAESGELRQLLFETIKQGDTPGLDPVNSPEEDAEKPTPENAPRIAREVTFRPDGTVQWEMGRSFHAATLQAASEQNLYGYKIDPEQLRAQQPPRGERLVRAEGEDSRTFAARKREQQLAERERQGAYRQLRDDLRELPETFSEPMPAVLYAAIEVPADDTLALQGPSPLPWTLQAEKKQLFEQLAQGVNPFAAEQGEALAGKVVTLIEGHPLDARAVAIATLRSKLAGQVSADDPGYEVLARLLQSKDIATRRTALFGVATVTPPSLASAKLIGVAGEAALGEERKMLGFASLGKLFATNVTEPDSARVLIERVSQTIADPEGPAAPQVIEQVLASLKPSQQSVGGPINSDVTAVMIEAIDLSGVEKDEFAAVAKAIIAQAPDNPVAAGWLDQHLLASSDRELVNKALSLLYESEIKRPVPQDAASADSAEVPAPPVDADALLLADTIAMARPNHALITLFDSQDDLQQAAAWAVLGQFHIALPKVANAESPEPVGEEAAVDPALTMFDAILAKANAREKTPASIVAFIVNQKAMELIQPANERLVAMLADPDLTQKTAIAAAQAYAQSPERFTPELKALDAEAQLKLIDSMYRAQDKEAPLMAGLIAGPGQTMKWFNDYLKAQGQLPDDAAWEQHAQSLGENALMQSAASQEMVVATAGAAGLAVAAGGDEQQVLAFAQKVAFMEPRQVDVVSAEWSTQREKIYASAFKRSAGTYQLVVTLIPPAAEVSPEVQGEVETPEQPGKRIDLGVVELRVEGVALSLSVEAIRLSPASGQLGIRLDNPASLRSFSKPELSAIPVEHLSQPIDMLPQDGGAWSGQTALPDGRSLEVSLEPVK